MSEDADVNIKLLCWLLAVRMLPLVVEDDSRHKVAVQIFPLVNWEGVQVHFHTAMG